MARVPKMSQPQKLTETLRDPALRVAFWEFIIPKAPPFQASALCGTSLPIYTQLTRKKDQRWGGSKQAWVGWGGERGGGGGRRTSVPSGQLHFGSWF